MNLSDFRFSMNFDFLDLVIVTPESTNFQTVRRRTGATYVWPLDAGPGGSASRFRCRLQDPPAPEQLGSLFASMPAKLESIEKIELSLDAFHATNDVHQLAAMAERMYYFTATPVSDNQRFAFAGSPGCVVDTGSRAINRRRLEQGWTLYIGNQGNTPDHEPESPALGKIHADGWSQRIYVKRRDANAALDPSLWRARFEWTFCRERLPFTTLDQAKQVTAAQFASYFKFRRYDDDLADLELLALQGVEQLGMKKYERGRIHDRRTKADTAFNSRTYDASRLLVARLNGSAGGRRTICLPEISEQRIRNLCHASSTT